MATSEQAKAWREANLEQRLAYEVEYRNRPDKKEAKREYDKARQASRTPEQIAQGQDRLKQYNGPDAVARTKAWRAANPEQNRRNRVISQGTRRARGDVVRFTYDEVLVTYGSDCHICLEGIDLAAPKKCGSPGWERSLWLDHVIPLAKGGAHSLENMRPSHALCNLKKSDK